MSADVVQWHEAVAEPGDHGSAFGQTLEHGRRPALWTFVVIELIGLIAYWIMGRHMWFALDEWNFIAQRGLSVHDVLEPYGGHLVAIPVVVYRTMFSIFGLRSYRPYQLVAIGTHLGVAALLRVAMRRAGVSPWIATAAASLFVLFGAGGQDVIWAFQIAFSGALAFGLTQLLLADHDGRIDRRDWFALAAGLGAICCSGVGLAMVVIVGVATFIRRGWRIAAFHTLPFLAIFEIWLHRYDHGAEPTTNDLSLIARWVGRGLWSTFDALGQVPLVGWLLAATAIAGLVVAAQSWRGPAVRQRAALPIAFTVGTLALLILIGYTRAWNGLQTASASRYLHITAALLILPIAVAADALVRFRRAFFVPLLALLIVGIPGNVAKITDSDAGSQTSARLRMAVLSIPRMELAHRVPGDVAIDPNAATGVTVRWLLDGARQGWIPAPSRPPNPMENATNTLRLELQETLGATGPKCQPLQGRSNLTIPVGKSLRVHGVVNVQLLDGHVISSPLAFGSTFVAGRNDHTVLADLQTLTLRVTPLTKGAAMC